MIDLNQLQEEINIVVNVYTQKGLEGNIQNKIFEIEFVYGMSVVTFSF
jgi:hypothetical protein